MIAAISRILPDVSDSMKDPMALRQTFDFTALFGGYLHPEPQWFHRSHGRVQNM